VDTEHVTSDLALAAFLCLRGLKLLSAGRETTGRFKFVFEDPEGKADDLHVEYLSSEFVLFDNFLRNLKKRIYRSP
jgi:hypothetical protein|tara:strand:- start:1284 stop:1511 length:228 start_codon:yes stop_codon:yes gene_type:complete